VRVVDRMDEEHVIYTVEIDQLCVVERAGENRVNCASVLDSRGRNSRAPKSAWIAESLPPVWRWGAPVSPGTYGSSLVSG